MKVKVNDWVNDAIYSDEFKTQAGIKIDLSRKLWLADKSAFEIPSQIEDHVRSLQSTASTQIRSFGRLFDSLKARFYFFVLWLAHCDIQWESIKNL